MTTAWAILVVGLVWAVLLVLMHDSVTRHWLPLLHAYVDVKAAALGIPLHLPEEGTPGKVYPPSGWAEDEREDA